MAGLGIVGLANSGRFGDEIVGNVCAIFVFFLFEFSLLFYPFGRMVTENETAGLSHLC